MKTNNRKQRLSPAYRAALDGVLAALCVALSALESALPDVAFLPPGAKLGFANLPLMAAVLTVGRADGLFLLLVKCGFALLTRGVPAFFMSAAGSLLSYLSLLLLPLLFEKTGRDYTCVFLSVVSAVLHNLGQLAAACVYTGTNLFPAYLPILLVFGAVAGVITGLVLRAVLPVVTKRIQQMRSHIQSKKGNDAK